MEGRRPRRLCDIMKPDMNNQPLTFEQFKSYIDKHLVTIDIFEKFVHHFDERIDDLALATANGFHEMDDRFEIVYKRLNHHDQEFKEIRQQLDHHDQEFKEVRQRLDKTEQGLVEVKQRLDKTDQSLVDVKHAVDRLNQSTHLESASTRVRLQHLEARVA